MVESWEDGGSTEETAYDPWTDIRDCEGIWKCHYPFVVGARKHSKSEAWVVLRAMGPTIAVIWFFRDYYSGTADRAVKTFTYKEEGVALAKAKEFGNELLVLPVPDNVVKAYEVYIERQANSGKKGGLAKARNRAAAAAKTAPAGSLDGQPATAENIAKAMEINKVNARKLAEGQ